MRLYGRDWTRRELESRVSRLEQIGGVRRVRLAEGPEDGVELIQVRTGSGLTYYVSPFHGLDISLCEFSGSPLSWQSENGDVHPAFYQPEGFEWLRTAAGGLLMTCGFTQAGAPAVDNGNQLGLHGRAHHLPARHVAAEGRWQGDSYQMRVSGVVEEAGMFSDHLRLTREIRSTLGENCVCITDEVENFGFRPSPHMLLYHFNFGFPLMAEETVLEFPPATVRPKSANVPLEGYSHWHAPQQGYEERVYYHDDLQTNAEGFASAAIHNPAFPVGDGTIRVPLTVRLSWDARTLPRMVQWKMPAAGVNVLGLEPANCHAEGRAAEREMGTLLSIEPGQSIRYSLRLEASVTR